MRNGWELYFGVDENNESLAKSKTSEPGQLISTHKGMANASLANVTALLLLFATVATVHAFEVDGIYYNITDGTNNTVEVTYHKYTGSVVIPESVTYNGTTYSVTIS